MPFEVSCKGRKRTFLLLGAFFSRIFPCFFAFLRHFVPLFYDELFFAPIFVVLKRCFSVSARFQAKAVPKNPDLGRKMFHVKQKQENRKREESIRQAPAGEESAREEAAREECAREARAEGGKAQKRALYCLCKQDLRPFRRFGGNFCVFLHISSVFSRFLDFLQFPPKTKGPGRLRTNFELP